jgi:hypothetical protein
MPWNSVKHRFHAESAVFFLTEKKEREKMVEKNVS